jgi:hypothetical protein
MRLAELLEYFPPSLIIFITVLVGCFVTIAVTGVRREWVHPTRVAFLSSWTAAAVLAVGASVIRGEYRLAVDAGIALAVLVGAAVPLTGSSFVFERLRTMPLSGRATVAGLTGLVLAPVAIIAWIFTACVLGGGACI